MTHIQIGKVFKNCLFLFFFTTYIYKNYDWSALSLLFKRVVFLQLDSNTFRDNNKNNKSSNFSKKKVELDIEKKYIYKKNEKLLWKSNIYIYLQFFI